MAATDRQPTTDDTWDGELLSTRPRRRLLSPPTVILAIVLFAVVGFFVGVKVEKGQVSPSGGASAASGAGGGARRSGAAAAGAGGVAGTGARGAGFAGGGGAAGAAGAAGGPVTTGTVQSTSGNTLYVQTASGNTVAVNTNQSTQVTRTVDATPSQVHPGETVVVQGTTGASGAITAITIRSNATAAAALSGLGG